MKKLSLTLFSGCLLLLSVGCEPEAKTEMPKDIPSKVEKTTKSTGYNLKYKLPADFSWSHKQKYTEVTTLNPGESNESTTKLTTVMIRKFNVKGIDKEEIMQVSMGYTSAYAEFKGPNSSWTYDSNSPNQATPPGGLDKMVGLGLDFYIDPNTGQVIEVVGGDLMLEAIEQDEKSAEQGNKIMREWLQREFYIYPDGNLDLKGSWKREGKQSSRFNVAFSHNYSLDRIETGQVIIKEQSTIQTLKHAAAIPTYMPNGNQIYHELIGSSTSEIAMKESNGAPFSRSFHSEMEGSKITLDASGGEKDRIPIRIVIDKSSEYGNN